MAKASKKSPEEKLRVGPLAGLARRRCVRASSHQDHRPRSSKLIARNPEHTGASTRPGVIQIISPRPARIVPCSEFRQRRDISLSAWQTLHATDIVLAPLSRIR